MAAREIKLPRSVVKNPLGAKHMAAQVLSSDDKRKHAPLNSLAHKSRPFETFIQALLFLCGVASIFTTVGIVLTLGVEASHFFTTPGTIAAERQLVIDITSDATQIELTAGGYTFETGEVIEAEGE